MEKYLLDTCTWIEYFHHRHGVREHVEQMLTTQICASEVTLAELTYGAINSGDYDRHIKEPQIPVIGKLYVLCCIIIRLAVVGFFVICDNSICY